MAVLKYLTGYPEPLVAQVSELLAQGKLGPWLQQRYPEPHEVRSDRQLYDYTQDLKDRYLRKSVPLNKVCYDNTLEVIKHALGTHTAISRVHGGRLKASREIRIATVFRQAPAAFLRMIVVHEPDPPRQTPGRPARHPARRSAPLHRRRLGHGRWRGG